MEITEEQRMRAEANRLAALEKRKRSAESFNDDAWRLFRCRKIPSPTTSNSSSSDPSKKPDPGPIATSNPAPPLPPPTRFRIFIEICSPTEFSVAPQPLNGFTFPGDLECFRQIDACLSPVVTLRTIESQGIQMAVVCKVTDHELVLKCLKTLSGVELQDIPHMTLAVVKKFQECVGNQWKPLWDGWYSDEEVDELLRKLPKSLRDALLPFQLEGVRFGLRRGGRFLIADEMGLGKTIQAIAVACCFQHEGPILVVCPAVLRFSWAEELEHWLPFLLPKDIHLVFGHLDNLNHLERSPKVVVISYTMLSRLRKSMLEQKWALLIVDEAHNIRCTKNKESVETEAVLELAAEVNRIILLSGTPSLSRPFDIYHQINMLCPRLLGKDKYEFAKNYCSMKVVQGYQGKIYKDFSKGIRLEELNVLLGQTLMIRRLKEHVLTELPPKRRQIIRLKLKKSDMPQGTFRMANNQFFQDKRCLNEFLINCSHQTDERNEISEDVNVCLDEECQEKAPKQLSNQDIGLAKLSGFREWFSNHGIIRESEDTSSPRLELDCQKMVIFAHHLKVLDGIQEFICEKGIQFVRIDGSTLARDRQMAVENFRLSKEVKIAIIGITAGGVGLDFSAARNVVFLELPKSASEMLQAEDRAHRRGQTNAVNIYIFCAKDTLDESHWLHLNKSLFRVSSLINGKEDAIPEIEVDTVLHLDYPMDSSNFAYLDNGAADGIHGENLVRRREGASGATEECSHMTSENTEEEKNNSIGTEIAHFETEDHDLDPEDHAMLQGNEDGSNCQIINHGQTSVLSKCLMDEGSVGFELEDNFVNKDESMHSGTNNVDDGTPNLVKADADCPIQVESLRFEVSQFTGRIHLYICIPGKDSRPRPLFVNFRPEDVELMVSAYDKKNERTQHLLKENPACCKIFQTFSKEWNCLRPIQQNKLLGKPLQLPLSLELCYLTESINHGPSGLLKGGSKKRVSHFSGISSPLPEHAAWKKVAICSSTLKEKEYFQAWTCNNEPLCKLCQQQCTGKLARNPEFFEDLFCSISCYQEYRIRTSQRALREELFQIEHGVCTQCKLDCHDLVKCIKRLSIARRKEYIENVAPMLAKQKKLFDTLVYEPVEGNAWHADHIVPVYKGGGECTLENMRTLCVVCHAKVTKAQQTDRKLAKRRAKEQLRKAIKELEDSNHMKQNCSNLDGTREEDTRREADEDDPLFVEVPGSAYSKTESC